MFTRPATVPARRLGHQLEAADYEIVLSTFRTVPSYASQVHGVAITSTSSYVRRRTATRTATVLDSFTYIT